MASSLPSSPSLSHYALNPFTRDFKPDIDQCDSDKYEELKYRLHPGGCSGDGFISDSEDLREVCLADSRVLQAADITHKQIGDFLDAIILKANFLLQKASEEKRCPTAAIINGVLRVPVWLGTGGVQECPFSSDIDDAKTWCGKSTSQITIYNSVDQKLGDVTELSGHLIRDHHLFQGSVRWRLPPQLVIDILGIKPGVDYSCKVVETRTWKKSSSRSYQSAELELAETLCAKYQTPRIALKGGAIAFIFAYTNLEDYDYIGMTLLEQVEAEGIKKGKTSEQIKKEIDFQIFFDNCYIPPRDSSKEIIKLSDKRYLHLFFPESVSFANTQELFDGQLPETTVEENMTHSIYKLVVKNEPVLDPSDTVEIRQNDNPNDSNPLKLRKVILHRDLRDFGDCMDLRSIPSMPLGSP